MFSWSCFWWRNLAHWKYFGPISCILANWMESWDHRLLIYPWILPTSLAPSVPRSLMKGWQFRYLWWHRGPFCYDTFISGEKLRTILTIATSFMIPSFLSVLRFSKKRPKWLNLWRYRGKNTQTFPICVFCQETFMRIETHCQSPLLRMLTLFVQFLMLWYELILTSLKVTLITIKWEYFMSGLLMQT